MWFDQFKIQAIEQALTSGNTSGLSSILPESPSSYQNPDPPAFCPKCGKPFKRKNLNYIPAVVPVCPDGHGVWLNEGVQRRLSQLLKTGVVMPRHAYQKQVSFRVFVFFLGVALVIFNAAQRWEKKGPGNWKMTASMDHVQKVGPKYWPTRDFSQWNVMPYQQEAITDPEEMEYFRRWMVIANAGIVNRLNMHDALLVERPAVEYADVYQFYSERQRSVWGRLNSLVPPTRLEVFHEHVVAALDKQIDFYDDFVRRKVEDPSVSLSQLLQNPHLVDCDKKLWAAFYELARLYPSRDAATNNAIEQRLCWLDMI